ncbi:26S proteasome regulatory subunit Rpn7p [Diutina catenulata]
MSDEIPRIPDYTLSETEFLYNTTADAARKRELAQRLLAACQEHNLGPYYHHLQQYGSDFELPQEAVDKMTTKNSEVVLELEQQLRDAEEQDETEIDVVATLVKLGDYYTETLAREKAKDTYKKAIDLGPVSGKKIDILLTVCRLEFFFGDYQSVHKYLEQVKTVIDKGGDWERRNRFKTYHGIYLMATRQFADAAALLIDSLATFTSTEICSYEQVAQYATICGALSLDRVDMKEKVIDSPEMLSIYSQSPQSLEPLVNLTTNLYTCQYRYFFGDIMQVYDEVLLPSKYLHQHANYFLREMRCKAYRQLLESYKSLSLKSMAQNFNVSEQFLDADLVRFIPNKKLNCTIDKVNGIIETNRPDSKNNQYFQLIKQGDGLLTKLQKYGAAVKLSGAERVQ